MFRGSVAACLVIACGGASAHDAGGHHDTLSRVYFETIGKGSTPDPYRHVEAFCAYLPDLSLELDAITQRRNAGSLSAWDWTTSSKCGSPIVKNMVSTQFYLHALTGRQTNPVRAAARAIIADIDADLARGPAFNPATAAPAERLARVNLWCERGFAAHLLADTFAHATLKDPAYLYPTGMGHATAGKTPDRMLGRDGRGDISNLWVDWVGEVYATVYRQPFPLATRTQLENVAARFKKLSRAGEDELVAYLRVGPDAWNVYPTPIATWGAQGLRQPFAPANCQAQIDAGPAAEPNGKGGPSAYGVRPNCATVWNQYFRRAVRHFGTVKPVNTSCQSTEAEAARAPLGGTP